MMRRVRHMLRRFASDREGSVLVETLIAVPVVTVLTVGVLEFGNIFWQRQLVQTGVRDAARYWSRCRPATVEFAATCSVDIARNIAFYGNPAGTGALRLPNWNSADDLQIVPAQDAFPSPPQPDDLVTVRGRLTHVSSPMFGLLGIDPITFTYTHSERYIGW